MIDKEGVIATLPNLTTPAVLLLSATSHTAHRKGTHWYFPRLTVLPTYDKGAGDLLFEAQHSFVCMQGSYAGSFVVQRSSKDFGVAQNQSEILSRNRSPRTLTPKSHHLRSGNRHIAASSRSLQEEANVCVVPLLPAAIQR